MKYQDIYAPNEMTPKQYRAGRRAAVEARIRREDKRRAARRRARECKALLPRGKPARPIINLVSGIAYPNARLAAESAGITRTSLLGRIRRGKEWAYADLAA